MNYSNITFPNLRLEMNLMRSFSIGSLEIHMYGALIAFGLLLAVCYALMRRKQFGLTEDDLLDGVLLIVPVAIIFTRAYYCIFNWGEFKDNPIEVFYIWQGGLAIYGGVIGAVLGIIAYCYFKKLKITTVLDITMLGFFIGQIIGRWGNFFNMEAFGSYTNGLFAMRIPAANLVIPDNASAGYLAQVEVLKQKAIEGGYAGFYQVHPTFLYESLWNLVGFIALHFLSKKRRYDGQVALGYAAWYGLGRFFIEGLRADSLYWGPFRVSQVLAAVSCVAALAVLLFNLLRPHDKAKLQVSIFEAREAAKKQEAEAKEETENETETATAEEEEAEEVEAAEEAEAKTEE